MPLWKAASNWVNTPPYLAKDLFILFHYCLFLPNWQRKECTGGDLTTPTPPWVRADEWPERDRVKRYVGRWNSQRASCRTNSENYEMLIRQKTWVKARNKSCSLHKGWFLNGKRSDYDHRISPPIMCCMSGSITRPPTQTLQHYSGQVIASG